MLTGWSD